MNGKVQVDVKKKKKNLFKTCHDKLQKSFRKKSRAQSEEKMVPESHLQILLFVPTQ